MHPTETAITSTVPPRSAISASAAAIAETDTAALIPPDV